ncbi:AAA family ATPase [Dolichospermum sp. ST_sed9]|nr:AAA family ATPase [Dolichospermum sp. ST_sed9]
MLKKLILENWKSFRYAELPLDPLTVLIGTNASGKSNVVEALEFLQRIANGENIEAALAGDKTLSSIRGGVEGAARKGENEFTLKILFSGEDDETDYLYVIKIQTIPQAQNIEEYIEYQLLTNNLEKSQVIKVDLQPPKPHNYSITESVDKRNSSREYSESELELINSYPQLTFVNQSIRSFYLEKFDLLKNILCFNPIPSKMRNYCRLSENIENDASNIAGVLAALTDDKKTEVENTLSYYIKDLPEGDIKKVWSEKVGRLGTDAMLYCQEEWKPGEITEIDARTMSDGTLRFLGILTALLTRPECSQIVIEEIDNGLHPSRAALLVKILKEIGSKRNIDILLTTHNPALLDAFGPEIVPFVVVAHRDSETGESKLTLLEDIENLPLLLASGTLGKLATKGAIEKSLSNQK